MQPTMFGKRNIQVKDTKTLFWTSKMVFFEVEINQNRVYIFDMYVIKSGHEKK